MTDAPAESRSPTNGPIGTSDRIALLDILRGFALFGVLFSNVHVWFSGRIFLAPAQLKVVMASSANVALDAVERFLIGGKFVTLFSFLFGLGLAVQFDRAEKRGQSAARFYARRGIVLLLLSAIHLFFLWYGDILHIYALLGFVVLVFTRRSPRTILIWGAVLTAFGAASIKWTSTIAAHVFVSPADLATQAALRSALVARTNEWMLSVFSVGSYGLIVKANAIGYWVRFVDAAAIGFFLEVLGRILVGFYAGKVGLFKNVPAHRRTFQRLAIGGFVCGVASEAIRQGLETLQLEQVSTGFALLVPGFMRVLVHLHMAGAAAFYVAAISLLSERPWWHEKLAIFAPAGRMAVTNYLSQSVLAILVFYGIGFGAIGNIGPLTTLCLPIGIFAAQMALSRLWLRHFRYGPVEWLWRSATYGAKQPMRR